MTALYFFLSSGFWSNTRIEAFLSKVPDDHMIILDLNSEQSPMWTHTQSYFGKPFIWCLLHNYGGTRGIYGNLTTIATGPIDAMNTPGSTMIGVGITPEAIEHNPVVYDLMVILLHVHPPLPLVYEYELSYSAWSNQTLPVYMKAVSRTVSPPLMIFIVHMPVGVAF